MMKEMRRVRERDGGEIERERWGHRVREMRGDERERKRERDSGQALLVVSIPMHACISVNVAGN